MNRIGILVFVFMLIFCQLSYAASVRIAWTLNTGTNPSTTGYKVYWGSVSKKYQFSKDVGNVSFYDITGLAAATNYYFAITAYNSVGESPKSVEVSATTRGTQITIDNKDLSTAKNGNWISSTYYPDFYGTDYFYSDGLASSWFEWRFTNLNPGLYQIFTKWTASPTRPKSCAYLIYTNNLNVYELSVPQDQTISIPLTENNGWKFLTTSYFLNKTGAIRLTSNASTDGACADAVKLLFIPEIILDNTSSSTARNGVWGPSTYYKGYYGSNYLYSNGSATSWFEWRFTNLTPGRYSVSVQWAAAPGRPKDAKYTITYADGKTITVPLDQRSKPEYVIWQLLTTQVFGSTATVRLTSGANSEGACADAIKLTWIP